MQIHLPSATVGALTTLSLVLLVGFARPQQVQSLRAGSPLRVQVDGVPGPRRIVNFDSYEFHSPNPVSNDIYLNVGETVTLYDVPADKYFVMTSLLKDGPPNSADVQLVELTVTGEAVKANKTFFAKGPHGTGFVFAPGSQVAVRNVHTSSNQEVAINFTGYLIE